jgi:hypothetical protein
MGKVLHLIARLYSIPDRVKSLMGAERLGLPVAIRAGDGETAEISGQDTQRSSAQEPGRKGRAL